MFAKLNSDKFRSQKILLDNLFITDYMPYAPDISVKAFLYGLAMACGSGDNSIETLAARLCVTDDEILSAFKYWEDQGLVTIISISPPQIEYREIKPASEQIRYYKKAKFKAFNEQLHAMVKGRGILPAEYNEYYYAIETLHIEQEAMLTIIAYCIRLKGENIGYPYILSVARSLAAEGITTYERVSERLSELDITSPEIKAVLKALGLKRSPDMTDKRLWQKWTKSLGFSDETIIKVAKTQKKGGMEKLDSLLNRYYENRVITFEEIERYNKSREKVVALTISILNILCKRYESIGYIIDSYTQKWVDLGFDEEALLAIAKECFCNNKREPDDMDAAVTKYYEQGLLTNAAITDYKAVAAINDGPIKRMLLAAGINREVASWDRDYYRTWTFSWKMPDDVILYAASLSGGKGLAYVGGILSNWNSRGIHDLESAKKIGAAPVATASAAATVTQKSVDELNALFDPIAPEDI